jgi:hypothetical protein
VPAAAAAPLKAWTSPTSLATASWCRATATASSASPTAAKAFASRIGSTNTADRNITSGNAIGGIQIVGTFAAPATATFRIEFFANDIDPLGLPAEGQQFIGFVNTTTDASGNASFNSTIGTAVTPGRVVTATATDPVGNTSEFSAGTVVVAVTPVRLQSFDVD